MHIARLSVVILLLANASAQGDNTQQQSGPQLLETIEYYCNALFNESLTDADCYGVGVDVSMAATGLSVAGNTSAEWTEADADELLNQLGLPSIEEITVGESGREVRGWLSNAGRHLWKIVRKLAKAVWQEVKAYSKYRGMSETVNDLRSVVEDEDDREQRDGNLSFLQLLDHLEIMGPDERLPRRYGPMRPDPDDVPMPAIVFSDEFAQKIAAQSGNTNAFPSSESSSSKSGKSGKTSKSSKASKSGKSAGGGKAKKKGGDFGKRIVLYAMLEAVYKRIKSKPSRPTIPTISPTTARATMSVWAAHGRSVPVNRQDLPTIRIPSRATLFPNAITPPPASIQTAVTSATLRGSVVVSNIADINRLLGQVRGNTKASTNEGQRMHVRTKRSLASAYKSDLNPSEAQDLIHELTEALQNTIFELELCRDGAVLLGPKQMNTQSGQVALDGTVSEGELGIASVVVVLVIGLAGGLLYRKVKQLLEELVMPIPRNDSLGA